MHDFPHRLQARSTARRPSTARHPSTARRPGCAAHPSTAARDTLALGLLTFALGLVGLALAGCGGAAPQAGSTPGGSASGSSTPQSELEALLGRERDPIGKRTVEGPGKAWKASIEAKSAPKIAREGNAVTVVTDVGLGEPIHCAVHTEPLDVGGSITGLLKRFAKLGPLRIAVPYQIDSLDGHPAAFVRALVAITAQGKEQLSDVKIMVAVRPNHSIVCVFDAPGYAKTFSRIAGGFAKSLRGGSPEPAHARVELWKMSIGDVPIGFSRHVLDKVGKDSVRELVVSAELIPSAPGALSTEDSIIATTADVRGRIQEGTWVNAHDGQVDHHLTLAPNGTGYAYEGSFKGKALKGPIASKAIFNDTLPLVEIARRVATSGKAETVSFEEYVPNIDPTRTTTLKFEVKPEANGALLVATHGTMRIELHADRKGLLRRWEMKAGGATIVAELIYDRGAL